MNYSLGELVEITRGTLKSGDRDQVIETLCTDSRVLEAGDCFVALHGPRFCGEDFLPAVLGKGAGGAIVHHSTSSDDFAPNQFQLEVLDTLDAYGDIARDWRRRINPLVIAVSGSAGKTTTKEMLGAIASSVRPTLATAGNLNNLIGLPRTLLSLESHHEIAVIETGMNVPGELARLTEICEPDVVIVTNVGNAHIGNFGDQEGLIRGESEIVATMNRDAMLVMNLDCPLVARIADYTDLPNRVLTFGLSDLADVRATDIEGVAPYGTKFNLHYRGEVIEISLPLYGEYQVMNALAATAGAIASGISLHVVAEVLNTFKAPKMRAQTEEINGVLLIADCYNASPDSMEKSIRSLKYVSGIKRRIVMMGDMRELGSLSEDFHRRIGVVAAECHVDLLCLLGKDIRWTADEASKRGVAVEIFDSREQAALFLGAETCEGDAILLKAARTLGFEDIAQRFREIKELGSSSDKVGSV